MAIKVVVMDTSSRKETCSNVSRDSALLFADIEHQRSFPTRLSVADLQQRSLKQLFTSSTITARPLQVTIVTMTPERRGPTSFQRARAHESGTATSADFLVA